MVLKQQLVRQLMEVCRHLYRITLGRTRLMVWTCRLKPMAATPRVLDRMLVRRSYVIASQQPSPARSKQALDLHGLCSAAQVPTIMQLTGQIATEIGLQGSGGRSSILQTWRANPQILHKGMIIPHTKYAVPRPKKFLMKRSLLIES
ncbi:unnamed protein product [Musa textilis]